MKKFLMLSFFMIFYANFLRSNAPTKPPFDQQLYLAIWNLNLEQVQTIVKGLEPVTVQEKQSLVDIARRKFDLCNQHKLTLDERVERIVKALHLFAIAYGIWRVDDILHWIVSKLDYGSILTDLGKWFRKKATESTVTEAAVLGNLLEAGVQPVRLISIFVALLGCARIFSITSASGHDKDIIQAAAIEAIISTIPIRTS